MTINKKDSSADKSEQSDNDNIIRFPDHRVQGRDEEDNQLSLSRQEKEAGELVSNVDRMIAKANKAIRKVYELDNESSDKILRILIERGLFKESQIHLSGHGLKGCLIKTDDGFVPLRDFLEEKYIGKKVVEHKTSNPSLQEDGGDELMSDDDRRIAEVERIMNETYNGLAPLRSSLEEKYIGERVVEHKISNPSLQEDGGDELMSDDDRRIAEVERIMNETYDLMAEYRDEILKIFIEKGFLEESQIHLDEEDCLIETDDGLIPLMDFSGYLRKKSIDRKVAEHRATKEGRTAKRRKTTLDYMREWDEKKKSEQQNAALKDED